MFIEKTSVISLLKKMIEKNEHTIVVVIEACRTVTELNMPEDVLVDARIRKLTASVHTVRIELAKVHFELNLKITQLELRAQPSTPPKFREQQEDLSRM